MTTKLIHSTLLLGALAAVLVSCSRGPKTCQVCERKECAGMAFRVALANGKTVETCCPRCGLHYLESAKQQARSLSAADYASGQWIDASNAVYVSGSDVSHCAPLGAVRDMQGCCAIKNYDRCLPSLIAFRDRTAAQGFQKQHGGELLAFEQLTAK